MHHVIKTQVFEVATDNSTDVFSLQHKLSSLFSRVILPAMERIFDELDPSETPVHIDIVEINLGLVTIEELDTTQWPDTFEDRLYRTLKEALQIHQRNTPVTGSPRNVSQQWLYYMEYGFLPWNTLQTDQAWYDQVLQELAGNIQSIEHLRKLIATHPNALRRIILLHPPDYLAHLLEALTAQKQSHLAQLIRESEMLIGRPIQNTNGKSDEKFGVLAWRAIFRYSVTASTRANEKEIVQKAILPLLTKPQLTVLLNTKRNLPLRDHLLPGVQEHLEKQSDRDIAQSSDNSKKQQIEKERRKEIPDEGVFVNHAGLVILHPFINQFFHYLHLTDNGKFTNTFAQQKGLGLLHFLATGNKQFEEHELVIPKILCGYAVSSPVDPAILISDQEGEDALHLLTAVIEEWSILKNASPTSLQESFLQRPGKLMTGVSGDLRLIVESDALDVLLDHLPWGLGIIKLPWMPQMLKVEWR